jgi:zinc/manganese transport system substrate-binding protein
MNRRAFVASLAFAVPSYGLAQSRRIEVVASFSIIADLVRQVGGDAVNVRSLVSQNGDAHGFEPRPSDAGALSRAQAFVINGLGFETWADRLVTSAGFSGERVVASRGVSALAVRGQQDPHAWQDPANVKVYVANIRDALSRLDPARAGTFAARAASYSAQLDALNAEIRGLMARIPAGRRKVITSHDAFTYFGDAYDVVFLAPQGVSTQAEASAQDVARLIRQIREEGIRAVFVENMANPRIVRQIAAETGVKVSGTLYADALGGAGSYLGMMRHNARQIAAALAR